MLASIERRISHLEAKRPRWAIIPQILDSRAPRSWLPQGIQRLTQKQSTIFLDPSRFRVVVAGRRSGKSYLSIAELIRAARSGTNKLCWYVAPSYRQAKQILWGPLKSAIPPRWIESKSEVDLSITLKGYHSTIALRSADLPNSLRGAGLDLAILDEFSSMAPVTWSEVIRPALADRQGHAIIQGSPRGYNALYDLYTQAQEQDDWHAFKFSTAEGGLVAEAEIEAVKATLDPTTYAQEFDADFTQSTNRVYLMFSREQNVRADLQDTQNELLIGIDFNVNPMSAVLGRKAGNQLHILYEVELHNANTQELAEALKRTYPGRALTAFPDPSGNARKTSAPGGQTDFTILRQAGLAVRAPSAAYVVVDRINTVNALFCNAKGQRRLFIHPRCRRLIESLERLSYRDSSNIPDKSQGYDHLPDGLAYLVCGEFPLVQGIGYARHNW